MDDLELDDSNNEDKEAVLMSIPQTLDDLNHLDYCIADSGASTHLTCSPKFFTNAKDVTYIKVRLWNGIEAHSQKVGDIPGLFVNRNGKKASKVTLKVLHTLTLNNVTYSGLPPC